MSDRHMIAALERVPAIVEAYALGDEAEAVRLIRRIPFGQWQHVAGYLLSMTLNAATTACGGDEDRARHALRDAIREGIHEDLVTNDVRQILRDAAHKEGMTE